MWHFRASQKQRKGNVGTSGIATGGSKGGQRKIAKNREKEGKNQEKSRKKMKNREEKAKIGKALSNFVLPLLTDRAGYATGW